jgi:hypothetical protein
MFGRGVPGAAGGVNPVACLMHADSACKIEARWFFRGWCPGVSLEDAAGGHADRRAAPSLFGSPSARFATLPIPDPQAERTDAMPTTTGREPLPPDEVHRRLEAFYDPAYQTRMRAAMMRNRRRIERSGGPLVGRTTSGRLITWTPMTRSAPVARSTRTTRTSTIRRGSASRRRTSASAGSDEPREPPPPASWPARAGDQLGQLLLFPPFGAPALELAYAARDGNHTAAVILEHRYAVHRGIWQVVA